MAGIPKPGDMAVFRQQPVSIGELCLLRKPGSPPYPWWLYCRGLTDQVASYLRREPPLVYYWLMRMMNAYAKIPKEQEVEAVYLMIDKGEIVVFERNAMQLVAGVRQGEVMEDEDEVCLMLFEAKEESPMAVAVIPTFFKEDEYQKKTSAVRCNRCVDKKACKHCTACGLAWYCSKECQHAAWKEHKPTCKKLQSLLQQLSKYD